MRSLPVFMRVAGRPVILVGTGDAADAKRRLLERAGAEVVGEEAGEAMLAIVACEEEGEAVAAVRRLRARGLLVNAVDRPALCDFTVPAIVDRDPVTVAIGTDGRSAGLAKALRQRLEVLLPPALGAIADRLFAARDRLAHRYPDARERRLAIDRALAPGGPLDPLGAPEADERWIDAPPAGAQPTRIRLRLRSADPDALTLAQARFLANADRVVHDPDVPPRILDRARADAARVPAGMENDGDVPGLTVEISMA